MGFPDIRVLLKFYLNGFTNKHLYKYVYEVTMKSDKYLFNFHLNTTSTKANSIFNWQKYWHYVTKIILGNNTKPTDNIVLLLKQA